MSKTDVLVVGAGPTGLMAAVCLRRQGVERVRIVDARDVPSKWAKASGIQPRSMEIIQQLDDGRGRVHEELCDSGWPMKGLEIRDYERDGRPVVSVDLSEEDANVSLLVEQWKTEEILTEHLSGLGVEIERGQKVKAFKDTGSCVEVELDNGERFEAKYVVGCDGAHSTTRHHLGVNFSGEKMPGTYALVHCMIDDMPLEPGVTRIDVGKKGWVFVTSMSDKSWIVVFELGEEDRAEYSPDKPSLEDLRRLLAERGIRAEKMHSPLWRTYFNVHSRQAERYSVGRIFLCGDAAHIHSPLGGQGMNMGLQDAHNLAWKLALVVRGEAAESILDSYHDERYEVDRDVLRTVEKMHTNLAASHPAAILVRNNVMRAVTSLPLVVHEVVLPRIGQTGYNYRNSGLCREDWGRIPLRHFLLRRSQNLLRVLGRRVKAGDRTPDCEMRMLSLQYDVKKEIPGEPLRNEKVRLNEWLARSGTGFKALLFQGLATHKLPNDQGDLALYATKLLDASEGIISGAAVVDEDPLAYKLYGVHGQCLMLIRPDGYVGLRLEPLSVKGVMAYLSGITKAAKVRDHGPLRTISPDPAPRFVLSALLLNLGYVAYGVCTGTINSSTYGIGSLLAFFGTWTFAEVKRDWYLFSPKQ